MKKLIIILTGIALAAAVVATGTYGLTQKNIDIYERAAAIDSSVTGFADFSVTDYPVAFYDGEYDYVVTWENGGYNIDRRAPVISFAAATAYPVDGHYEVLAPTVEKMSSLLGIMSMGEAEYGTEEQVATIWHEAFHCYQLTNFYDNIEKICSEDIDESIISEYADANSEAVRLFTEQSELLEKAVKCEVIDNIREYMIQYKQLDMQRKALLSEDVNELEEYYTIVEGTACYVEACVYRAQLPERFAEEYIDNIGEYRKGSSKYYRAGMAQCMILGKLDADWKNELDFSGPLTDIIYRELEI
ncbi:MAG: hypothetical protein ACI4J5_02050 [Oscillospiraceae bacterium]